MTKQKRQGFEIKKIRGNYYMYERKSVWDPMRKKAKKVTGAYVGKVTPEGVVPKRMRIDAGAPVLSVEFGAAAFLAGLSSDLLDDLRERFEDGVAERVWASAMLRLVSPCPFKRIAHRYETSWLSHALPGLALSPSSITRLLDVVGNDRRACAAFMRDTMESAPYVLIDGTGTISQSERMARALPGHSNAHGYIPQVNQIYVVSVADGGSAPAFYRNVTGNVPDVTALALTVRDAGIENAVVVADAGFASGDNFAMLADAGLDCVVPLKRNTSEIDLAQTDYETVFNYHHRAISAHSESKEGYRICVFRDEKLRADEMADFVGRGEKANAEAEKRKSIGSGKNLRDVAAETRMKTASFGTIILRTSLVEADTRKIYETYKVRWEIEQLFDTMRNTVGQDASFMRDDPGFEAWTFINHVTLLMACRVLAVIRGHDMLKDWSLAGVLDHLSRVHAVQVANEWTLAEVVGKTRKLMSDLSIKLDIKSTLIPKR
ncbi:MAG: transposase [Clostridiales Family XIII bacterium]|nr:transposase [Clostridiales Family XIII bacterium]